MEASDYLLSGILTGLFLLGTVFVLARNRNWQHYSPAREASNVGETVERLAGSPSTWIAGFVLLTLGLGLGTLVVVGGLPVPEGVQGAATVAMAVVVLAVLAGYVFLGVYHSIRYRGLYRSQAAAAGIWIVATLAVAGIAVMLLTAG